jgi:hypothetical protein
MTLNYVILAALASERNIQLSINYEYKLQKYNTLYKWQEYGKVEGEPGYCKEYVGAASAQTEISPN